MLQIDHKRCHDCGGCVPLCPPDSLTLTGNSPTVNNATCTDCNICVIFCPVDALKVVKDAVANPLGSRGVAA